MGEKRERHRCACGRGGKGREEGKRVVRRLDEGGLVAGWILWRSGYANGRMGAVDCGERCGREASRYGSEAGLGEGEGMGGWRVRYVQVYGTVPRLMRRVRYVQVHERYRSSIRRVRDVHVLGRYRNSMRRAEEWDVEKGGSEVGAMHEQGRRPRGGLRLTGGIRGRRHFDMNQDWRGTSGTQVLEMSQGRGKVARTHRQEGGWVTRDVWLRRGTAPTGGRAAVTSTVPHRAG